MRSHVERGNEETEQKTSLVGEVGWVEMKQALIQSCSVLTGSKTLVSPIREISPTFRDIVSLLGKEGTNRSLKRIAHINVIGEWFDQCHLAGIGRANAFGNKLACVNQ